MYKAFLFHLILAFGKLPITDLKFISGNWLRELPCFNKFISHSNEKLISSTSHQIELLIHILEAVDKLRSSERCIGEKSEQIINHLFAFRQLQIAEQSVYFGIGEFLTYRTVFLFLLPLP